MPDRDFIERWLIPATDLLARYHRFELHRMECLRQNERSLLIDRAA